MAVLASYLLHQKSSYTKLPCKYISAVCGCSVCARVFVFVVATAYACMNLMNQGSVGEGVTESGSATFVNLSLNKQ